MSDFEVVDLRALAAAAGGPGELWSAPEGGSLAASLVRLESGAATTEHVNRELDLLIVGVEGDGVVEVGGTPRRVAPGVLALVPAGVSRRVMADAGVAVSFLTVHRGVRRSTAGRPGRVFRRRRERFEALQPPEEDSGDDEGPALPGTGWRPPFR